MKYTTFGKTGLRVSRLGIGSLAVGPTAQEQEQVVSVMNWLLDEGANLVDTAQCYRGSEELIGRSFSHRRRDFILVSKCGHHEVLPDGSLRSLAISTDDIDQALRKLRTDYLDVMLLHSYDYDLLQKGDALDVLRRAREAGKIRFLGYSGDNERALWAVVHGGVDVVEMSISLCDQYNLNVVVPQCVGRDTAVIAKRPIGNAAWQYVSDPEKANTHIREYAGRFRALALRPPDYGCADMAELALRFTLSLDGVHCAIASSRSAEHISGNLRAVELGPLHPEHVTRLRRRFAEVQHDWTGCN